MITANIASYLPLLAKKQPDTFSVVVQDKNKLKKASYDNAYTYQQLDEVSDLIANGLQAYGIKKGTRTVVMVKPGLDFFALVFALFKLEAILVMVDPGMGIKNLGQCLQEAEPEAFIGNSKANTARVILGWAKNTIHKTILVGGNVLSSKLITSLDEIKSLGKTTERIEHETKAEDIAAILFTSGSTGVPKGVVYTHANFTAQVKALKALYNIQPGEVDLATFPLFALFAPALGMTSIIPQMDFTKPGSVDPIRIIDAVNNYKCTNMFGSPALLNRVGKWSENKEKKLPSLKRVLSAGAPVAPVVLKKFKILLNKDVEIFTPYGATESLPVSSIGSDEIINETAKATAAGKGVCIGKPVEGLDVRIIRINDSIISEWSDELELPANQIGEICVKGPQVTASYFNRDKQTALAKITSKDCFYHRMGDLERRRPGDICCANWGRGNEHRTGAIQPSGCAWSPNRRICPAGGVHQKRAGWHPDCSISCRPGRWRQSRTCRYARCTHRVRRQHAGSERLFRGSPGHWLPSKQPGRKSVPGCQERKQASSRVLRTFSHLSRGIRFPAHC